MSAEVKHGYKLTEVGVIPEDWSVVSMDAITTHIGDGLHGTPVYSPNGKYFFINGNNLNDGKIVITSDTKSVDHSEFIKHQKPISDRSILMSINGTIGNLGLFDSEQVLLGKSAAFLNVNPKISKRYVYQSLKTQIVKQQFFDGLTGSTIGNLGLSTIRRTKVPLPPTKAEQRAIAEALSDADALIESLEQLIAKKRQIKQGAMQELLNPKAGREKVKLGSLGVFLKGCGVKKDESMSGNIPCIRYGEIYTKHKDYIKAFDSWISPEVALTAKRIKCGDILFAGSGETKEEIGKCVAFVDDIEAYAGGDIVILRPNNANSLFLGHYLNTESVNRQKANRGQGDAVVHIASNALADIDLIIPSVDEQAVIASVLFDMESEIDALETKLAKVQKIKRGMMLILLTGKIRLI